LLEVGEEDKLERGAGMGGSLEIIILSGHLAFLSHAHRPVILAGTGLQAPQVHDLLKDFAIQRTGGIPLAIHRQQAINFVADGLFLIVHHETSIFHIGFLGGF
jgi:hypothetical protein